MRKLRLSLVILISSLLYLVGSSMAQEGGLLPGETLSQPKERPVTVSATVPDREPPASAILVSPENNQFINTRRPQLRWRFDADTTGTCGPCKAQMIPLGQFSGSLSLTPTTTRTFSSRGTSNSGSVTLTVGSRSQNIVLNVIGRAYM